jgi:hypothetical protein
MKVYCRQPKWIYQNLLMWTLWFISCYLTGHLWYNFSCSKKRYFLNIITTGTLKEEKNCWQSWYVIQISLKIYFDAMVTSIMHSVTQLSLPRTYCIGAWAYILNCTDPMKMLTLQSGLNGFSLISKKCNPYASSPYI